MNISITALFIAILPRFLVRTVLLCVSILQCTGVTALELKDEFTSTDAVLITKAGGETVYAWQRDKPLIPASLTKLVTAQLAIDRWGLDHRFHTEFFVHDQTLWG